MYRIKLYLHGNEVKELSLESGKEYTFGRAPTCDIMLNEQPGISRVHFKIVERDGHWIAQVISKFGELVYAGQPTQTVELEEGTAFKLGGYDFKVIPYAVTEHAHQIEESHESMQMAVGQSEMTGGGALVRSQHHLAIAPASFDGNDEATRVAKTAPAIPFLRIVKDTAQEETLKLEGRQWTAGRDQSCEVFLDDRKASRKQFELTSSPQGFFVRDLGSSNGTSLNGNPLAPDELKPIRSGDLIQVGLLAIHFEVRDPNFEKRLMVVPQEVLSALPVAASVATQQPYEMINYPVLTGPGGAVRIDQGGGNQIAAYDPYGVSREVNEAQRRGKVRFYMILGTVLLVGGLFYYSNPPKEEKKPAPAATVVGGDAFSKLIPAKQQHVKETYLMAKNLYMQGKLALAADQLAKLHEILPDGYENSKAMAEDCRSQAEQQELQAALKREQERLAADKREVEANLKLCEPMSNTTYDVDVLKSCLGPTLERDPGNGLASEYELRVQRRIEQRSAKQAASKVFADQASHGRVLYQKAVELEKRGEIFAAIDAYRKHLASTYPDPEGLKNKSRENVARITGHITSQIDEAMKKAETAYSGQNYKVAIDAIKKAKSLDPNNQRASELNGKIQHELAVKLRPIYEEGVILEGLGKVTSAMEEWKKIIEIDHPDNEYYKKARSKMRIYSSDN